MKVLQIIPSVNATGPVNVALNLVEHQKKRGDSVFVVYFWGTGGHLSKFREHSEKVYNIKPFSVTGIKVLIKIIKNVQPDIIHTHCLVPDLVGASLKVFFGLKTVSTLHCNINEDYKLSYGLFKEKLYGFVHKKLLKRIDAVAAVSLGASNALSSSNTCVIHNGVEERLIDRESSGKYKLFFVGRLTKGKNAEFLIHAMSDDKFSRMVDLHIYGDGDQEKKLMDMAKTTIGGNIYFHGFTINPYNEADNKSIFVSASLSEGLPMAVLEALSAGIPCVLSNISGHREIQREFHYGVNIFDSTVCFRSAIMKLIVEWDKKNTEIIKSVFRKEFSNKVMESKYHDLYTTLHEG